MMIDEQSKLLVLFSSLPISIKDLQQAIFGFAFFYKLEIQGVINMLDLNSI